MLLGALCGIIAAALSSGSYVNPRISSVLHTSFDWSALLRICQQECRQGTHIAASRCQSLGAQNQHPEARGELNGNLGAGRAAATVVIRVAVG